MNILNCLTGVVGLTREETACLTSGENCDFTASKSGLFIDEIEGGISLRAVKNIDSGKTLCDMLTKVRSIAEQRTGDDIVTALSMKYSNQKHAFIGNVGQMNFTNTNILTKQFAGVLIKPRNESGDSIIVLKSVNININLATPVTLQVLRVPKNGQSGTVVLTLQTNATSGSWTSFDIPKPIRLPLTKDGIAQEYYLLYDRSLGFNPKNNKASCGCGESERYQKQFIDTYGVELNDLNMLTNQTSNSLANGLVLGVEIRCDRGEFVCREFDANDGISITLAYATMYKAAELLIEEVLRAPEVSRYTLMNREYLWGKRNNFKKEYEDRIKYVAQNIDPHSSDCFVCKSNDMIFGGILS